MDAAAGLPAGAKFGVVSGDPSKAGDVHHPRQIPANYAVPPHHHPGDEMVSVKDGGTLQVGMGDKLDKAKARPLRSTIMSP